MEPSDALFTVVEASIALAGFSGIVSALGQRSIGIWQPNDRARIVDLLTATLVPFVFSLFSLILIYAEIESVWRVSSAALALGALVALVSSWCDPLRVREERRIPIGNFYVAVVYSTLVLLAVLQVWNLFFCKSFWPYFAGLAVILIIGVSQFVRLLWFGIQDGRPT